MNFLNNIYYGNSLGSWLTALLLVFATILLLKILKKSVASHLTSFAEKTKTNLDDIAAELLTKTNLFFIFFLSLYVGSLSLIIPKSISKAITILATVSFILQVSIWVSTFISLLSVNYIKKKPTDDNSNTATIKALSFIVKLILWIITFMLILENLGIDVTALIAGLGVGGIAVALAMQNVLGDLMASLSIVFDKPFVLGDFIIVGDFMGTVEHVGLKTTRLRSLSGEQIIFSNTDLLQSRVRNYKRMFERRIQFKFGILYSTAYEKVAKIPEMMKDIIEAQNSVRFDRAHFKEYGDFALNYEVVYYVLKPEYNIYMDIQQGINLEMMKKFSEEGIEFAFPTQTLYVNQVSANIDK